MRSVLINNAGVRLGEHDVDDDVRLIRYGGAYFVRGHETALIDAGGTGPVFEETLCDIVVHLALENATSNYSKRQGRR